MLPNVANSVSNRIISDIRSANAGLNRTAALVDLSMQLYKKLKDGADARHLIVEAFALVDEAVFRTFGFRAFDVQIEAGIALFDGKLIEMNTGEGKTLTAVFPAYLSALARKGVHILTANDYLARRDAEWMNPVYKNLGVSVGFIQEGMQKQARREAYNCDITYVTAKEAGFDYLRDCLCYETNEIVHRPFHYAIIDEADSIMIDEARIPLVIAARTDTRFDGYEYILEIVDSFIPGHDFNTDDHSRNVFITDAGIEKAERYFGCDNLYDNRNSSLLSRINFALHANTLLKRDVDYIVNDGQIELIDEFTGRVAEKRHWPDGLQAAVEAKEGLPTKQDGRIMNTITMPDFIRLYPGLAGMTGTAMTSADEFLEVYGLDVVSVPTNKPCVRTDDPDIIFATKDAKYKALVEDVVSVHSTRRPILIGTCSIAESELIADMLSECGVKCIVLNAKNDEYEAEIIADAGSLSAVTVSTNMAGRGTDIRLGGASEKDKCLVSELGGLFVIGTNRHESVRIDNQLRGRAGRQGDPGSTRFYVSMEDGLMQKYYSDNKNRLRQRVKQDKPQKDMQQMKKEIIRAQQEAENQNREIRRTLGKYAEITETHRKIILKKRKEAFTMIPRELSLWEGEATSREDLVSELGLDGYERLKRSVALHFIDLGWADYLEQAACIKDGIHLVRIAGQQPLEQYLFRVSEAFEEMNAGMCAAIIDTIRGLKASKNGVNVPEKLLKGPSATWTYMLNDDPFNNDLGLMLASTRNIGFTAWAATFSFASPIMVFSMLYKRIKGRRHVG